MGGGKWGKVANFGAGIYPSANMERGRGIYTRETSEIRATMRFTGTIEAKADAKGRVFFPAAFRKILAASGEEQLVLTRDLFQPCLVVYPWSVWNEQLDALRSGLSRWNARHRMLLREFVADVEIATLDAGGRLLIPKRYAAMAEIGQDVVILGMDDTVELWSRPVLEARRMKPDELAAEMERAMNGEQ